MKNILFVILIAFSHSKCSAQTKLNAWLPEDYVKSMNAKDTTSYKYLIPIEGFESIFGYLHWRRPPACAHRSLTYTNSIIINEQQI